jgi:hypothetical protein
MEIDKQTNENGLAWTWAAAMAVAAGLVRLIPFNPWNFTPVGALGLFGGARLRSWWAYVLPLGVMAVSDLLLWAIHGLHYTPFNPWVYACFALSVLWGRLFLRSGGSARLVAVSVLVSVQFFLVTNLGVWLASSVDAQTLPEGTAVVWKEIPGLPAPVPTAYARNPSGLLACYVAALPFAGTNAPPLGFFGNQLIGDLFYSGLLFGAYAWLRSSVPASRRRALAAPRIS